MLSEPQLAPLPGVRTMCALTAHGMEGLVSQGKEVALCSPASLPCKCKPAFGSVVMLPIGEVRYTFFLTMGRELPPV